MEKETADLMKTLLNKQNIDAYLEENSDEFVTGGLTEELGRLLTLKGTCKRDVIREAGLDRVYGYQLFNGQKSNPSRDKVLCLAFGLHLSVNETQNLLHIAEKPELYPRSRRDSIIIFCINSGRSLIECDTLLEQNGQDLLSGSPE